MVFDLPPLFKLRVLVVDDDARWRKGLRRVLRRLEVNVGESSQVDTVANEIHGQEKLVDGSTQVDTAANEIEGQEKLAGEVYDLAVVDLALLGDPPDGKKADDRGFELLRKLRENPSQRRCGVIVVTGTATSDNMHRALQDKVFDVKEVVVKAEYDDRDDPESYLLNLARAAILHGRVHGTAKGRVERSYLTMTFDATGWIASELRSPKGVTRDQIHPPAAFDVDNYVRRADNINFFLSNGETYTDWRPEMADLGATLFKSVTETPKLYDKWAGSKPLVKEPGDLWLRFKSPAKGLGVPVDLLRENTDYLCLRHILSREVERTGFTRTLAPFSEFVDKLGSRRAPLRLLLVAANSNGTIPSVDDEAQLLADDISTDLQRIGLRCDPTLLTGKAASYDRVKNELLRGRHHIFHYAGHGRYDDHHPEASGLILSDGGGTRALTAADLSLIVGSDLQLVFLSCCLGAVNKTQPTSDELCGIYHALAHADVPTVVGHRWVVSDTAALLFASNFYAHLWRTLCPGEALLEARREAAMGKWGLNDHTWAAPVLLTQSP